MRIGTTLATAFAAVRSLTLNQQAYLAALKDPGVSLVIATGMAGTGKTMLACTEGVNQVRSKNFDRVVITRPTVGIADNDIGFLPGALDKKMAPWLRPMAEYISDKRIVQTVPIGYMRGYTIRDSFIVVDECQNLRTEALRMILSRIGEGSKLVLTGDLTQSDLRGTNGFDYFLSRIDLAEFPEVRWITFGEEDCRRHPLIPRLMKIFQ